MKNIFFKIGDLVEESHIDAHNSPYKTVGIVTKIRRLKANDVEASDCQAVQVFWAEYGQYWTTSLRLKRVASAELNA
tara:strand:+ start:53 stop:283 length:231 start_codon:yes stop_codon:yes gene_type:complete